jgi:hypothetical protein
MKRVFRRLTLERKFDAVHSTTVASKRIIPTVCLHRLCCDFLLSDQGLTILAGDITDEPKSLEDIASMLFRRFGDPSMTEGVDTGCHTGKGLRALGGK